MTNPCRTATLSAVTDITNMSFDDHTTGTEDFTDIGDSFTATSSNYIFCGARTFSVEDGSGNAVSWLAVSNVSGATYRITGTPDSSVTEL